MTMEATLANLKLYQYDHGRYTRTITEKSHCNFPTTSQFSFANFLYQSRNALSRNAKNKNH